VKSREGKDQYYEIYVLLHHIRDLMVKAREKELRAIGISHIQRSVLFSVSIIGNKATPAELARWLFREPHSMSELLSRMEKAGLVKKVKDLKKKNLVRIVLTEKGRKAYELSTRHDSIDNILSCLSQEELQQFEKYLHRLRDKALNELGIEYKDYYPVHSSET
jgi:DNA-binding MarR family transcriptional regulator